MTKDVREKKNVYPSVIEEASKLIADGKIKRLISELLGMSESTLRRRLKKETVAQSLGRFICTFTPQTFFGITVKQIRRLAFDFAEENKITHQFNK